MGTSWAFCARGCFCCDWIVPIRAWNRILSTRWTKISRLAISTSSGRCYWIISPTQTCLYRCGCHAIWSCWTVNAEIRSSYRVCSNWAWRLWNSSIWAILAVWASSTRSASSERICTCCTNYWDWTWSRAVKPSWTLSAFSRSSETIFSICASSRWSIIVGTFASSRALCTSSIEISKTFLLHLIDSICVESIRTCECLMCFVWTILTFIAWCAAALLA